MFCVEVPKLLVFCTEVLRRSAGTQPRLHIAPDLQSGARSEITASTHCHASLQRAAKELSRQTFGAGNFWEVAIEMDLELCGRLFSCIRSLSMSAALHVHIM